MDTLPDNSFPDNSPPDDSRKIAPLLNITYTPMTSNYSSPGSPSLQTASLNPYPEMTKCSNVGRKMKETYPTNIPDTEVRVIRLNRVKTTSVIKSHDQNRKKSAQLKMWKLTQTTKSAWCQIT